MKILLIFASVFIILFTQCSNTVKVDDSLITIKNNDINIINDTICLKDFIGDSSTFQIETDKFLPIFMSGLEIAFSASHNWKNVYAFKYNSLVKINVNKKKIIKSIRFDTLSYNYCLSKNLNGDIGLITYNVINKDTLYGELNIYDMDLIFKSTLEFKIFLPTFPIAYDRLLQIRAFDVNNERIYFTDSYGVSIEFFQGVCVSSGEELSIIYDYVTKKRYYDYSNYPDSLILYDVDEKKNYSFIMDSNHHSIGRFIFIINGLAYFHDEDKNRIEVYNLKTVKKRTIETIKSSEIIYNVSKEGIITLTEDYNCFYPLKR